MGEELRYVQVRHAHRWWK